MGTSSSSSGPGAGVPFDPPWLSSVASEIGSPLEQISGDGAQQEQPRSRPSLSCSLLELLLHVVLEMQDGIWGNMQAVVTELR